MTADGVHASPCTVFNLVYGAEKEMTYTSAEVKDEKRETAFCGCAFISNELIMVVIRTKLVIMDIQLNEIKVINPKQVDPCGR